MLCRISPLVIAAALLAALAVAACGEDPAATPPPPPRSAVLDAGVAPAPSDAAAPTIVPGYDPASGYHLDEDTAPVVRRPEPGSRIQRTLQLMLVSTPTGAIAAVDGKVIGRTPVYWEGPFTGQEREFTFVLPGYTIGRYRFVPLQGGFVHGTLRRVTIDGDAGVPEIPVPLPPGPLPTAPTPAPAPRRPAPRAAPIVPDAGPPAAVPTPGPDAGPPPPPVDSPSPDAGS